MIESPMLLAVAPNGARKQYTDHSALPITADELANTAESCLMAGAGMMHVHVRDENKDYQHCLDAKKYSDAFIAIRERVGDNLFLQATTEAVGLYSPIEQMSVVRELAELQCHHATFGISLAVRELMNNSVSDDIISSFFTFLQQANILPQLIIYNIMDRLRFQQLLVRGVLPGNSYPCLFVLGRYSLHQQSDPAELLPFFSDLTGVSSWMGCAFGAREASVAKACALLGGHMRIGYENNTLLADGRVSINNAELIAQTANELDSSLRRLAEVNEIVEILRPDW